MGSVAAARRTQGAYPAYLAATNPSDLTVLTGLSGPADASGYDPAVIRKIAALPGVRHVASYAGLNVAILGLDGQPVAAPYIGGPLPGSLDGEYFTTDRVTAVQGRLPDPSRPDEIAIDAKGTPATVRVGTVAELGFYTNAQLAELYAGKQRHAGRPAAGHGRRRGRLQRRGNAGRHRHPARRRRAVHPRADQEADRLLRQLHRDRRPAAAGDARGRCGGRHPAGAARRVPHRVLRHLAHRGQGAAGHRAHLDRPGGLRRHRRPGRADHRGAGHRPPVAPRPRRPRDHARARRGPGGDDGRRPARGPRRHRRAARCSPRPSRSPCHRSRPWARSGRSTRPRAWRSTGPCSAAASR